MPGGHLGFKALTKSGSVDITVLPDARRADEVCAACLQGCSITGRVWEDEGWSLDLNGDALAGPETWAAAQA